MEQNSWMPYKDYIHRKAYYELMEEHMWAVNTGWLGKLHTLPLSEEVIQERIELIIERDKPKIE